MNGVTKTGFEFEIDERKLSDYRLLSALGKVTSEDCPETQKMSAIVEMTEFILGDEKNALLEHVSSLNNGFCPIKAVEEEIGDIIISSKKLKN